MSYQSNALERLGEREARRPPSLARPPTLEDLEERIAGGWLDMADALNEIRTHGLYKPSYPTFDDYVKQRWGFSRQHVTQLTTSANAIRALVTAGYQSPATERQARALSQVPESQRAVVWAASQAEHKTEQPSSPQIVQTAGRIMGTPVPKPEGPRRRPSQAQPELPHCPTCTCEDL